MTITAKSWSNYVQRLRRLNEKAANLMQAYIDRHGTEDVASLIAYANALVTKYGEGSATLAAQMYDELAEIQNAQVAAAVPAETPDYGTVAKMVKATITSPSAMIQGVSRLVKQAGADTTLQNARRDRAQFAWIPHGDTCAFCLMLASNGWRNQSQNAMKNGHASHIHSNCDCTYAVRFDSRTTVAGYDPDRYLEQYRAANGNLNAMRRADYQANKDMINAQKRAAYLRRKNRRKKVNITDIAIQKVPLIAPNGIDQQTAFFVQETHRELLRFAQTQNDSNEVACVLDLTSRERLPFVKGEQDSVDIEKDAASYHWLRSRSDGSIMLCHNHPGQSYFSLPDVVTFLQNDSIGIMSIVTNQGKMWTISKTSKYDYSKAIGELLQHKNASEDEWDEIIDRFLKNGYTCGIERG